MIYNHNIASLRGTILFQNIPNSNYRNDPVKCRFPYLLDVKIEQCKLNRQGQIEKSVASGNVRKSFIFIACFCVYVC